MRKSSSARSRSPQRSASTPTRTLPSSSYRDAKGTGFTSTTSSTSTILHQPGPRGRNAPVAGGNAAQEDRCRAGSLHRRPGGGEEGRRHRGAQPLAARAGARKDPGRDHAAQHHHDRADGRGKNRDRAPAGAARGSAVPQGRGVVVHRGGGGRPRAGGDGACAGGGVDQHRPLGPG